MPSKSTMCNICGKVMRSDHLQRHVKAKHENEEVESRQSSTEKCASDQEKFSGNVVKSYDCKDVDAKLEFELQRDRDVYLKNANIGRQVAIVLRNGDIPEESLSKQNKFCLELFRAQQPTTDVANANSAFECHWTGTNERCAIFAVKLCVAIIYSAMLKPSMKTKK